MNTTLNTIIENYRESFLSKEHISKTLNIEHLSVIQSYINGKTCPHCNSKQIIKKGKYKSRRRYLCKECQKYFNDLTGTPFDGIHDLVKLRKYLQCMIEGDSIRKAARKVSISITTSFAWRHKLLDKMKTLSPPNTKNTIELEEIKIPYSAKGQRTSVSKELQNTNVSIIFSADRHGKVDSESILYPKRRENEIFERIDFRHNLVVSNRGVFDKINNRNIKSQSIKKSQHKKRHFVLKEVNRWNNWMKRFYGVATKYLNNYLHWFDFLENSITKPEQTLTLANLLLHDS
jgi:transposase-like protein